MIHKKKIVNFDLISKNHVLNALNPEYMSSKQTEKQNPIMKRKRVGLRNANVKPKAEMKTSAT